MTSIMTKPALVLAVLLSLSGCSLQRKPLSCELTKVDPHTSTDMRDDRYCEILFMHAAGPLATGCVYTTYGLNKCPPAKWEALDPKELVHEYQVDQAIMNGPRFWVMDTFTIDTQGSPTSIDGLEMKPGASIDMPPGAMLASHAQRPYTETAVARNTIFTYAANKPVYKLVNKTVSPERTYIMQAYSRIVDPTLTINQLATLGSKLDLPSGWSYVVETPTSEIVLKSGGTAYVTQDSLQNTYQRMD
jgi:haloalkane dehalogenase